MPPKFNKSGLLVVDKPAGLSSAAAIRKIQKRFNVSKIGHGGTLDPFATGVLIVLVGEATKVARFLLDGDKSYEAVAQVGWETTTDDCDGEPIHDETATNAVPPDVTAWEKTRTQFVGTIAQVPPIYSAIKVQGKRAYAYARAQEAVVLEPRSVQIHALDLLAIGAETVTFRVACGGGTYIRALARDWARAAGKKAHLQSLRRLRVGNFTIEGATKLEDLLNAESLDAYLHPLMQALAHLPERFCGTEVRTEVRAGNLATLSKIFENADYPTDSPILLTTAADNGSGREPLAIVRRQADLRKPFVFERVFVSP